jgi:Protein of unknown function (DUF3309)
MSTVRTADTKPSRTVIISITSSTDGSITHMAIIATTTDLCSWSEIDTTALRAVRKSSVHAERLAAHGLGGGPFYGTGYYGGGGLGLILIVVLILVLLGKL